MSSASSFNTIRRHSSNAADIRLKELTQELARTRSEITGSQLETDDVRSQGRMDHSTIKVNDDRLKFVTTLQSSNTDFFYEFPTEPDLNYLKVWFMLDHLGARMRDMSGFGNHAFISGHPTLRRVGLNLGFQQTSDAGGTSATPTMLFNSGTDVVSQKNGEYIWIQDNPSIQFSLFPVGFSITFRFNCLDFNNHISAEFGSFVRRFAAKTDNATNGWNLVVYQIDQTGLNGVLEMHVVHDGVTYKRRRVGFDINAWYQVVVTYDPNVTADARIKIYVAGTEGTTAGTTSLILSPHTNLRIGARDSETGFFYGYLHDFRLYMNKVLTQTEVTNINTNEMTIDSITRGHVFVIQYAMVSQAMRSKTHRYNVGGYIIRERHHKFNIIKKLTVTKTHKFSVVMKILPVRTRTHKFNITTLVARTRTHKFSLGGVVLRTRTHKFNIIQKITRTKTHKYNIGAIQNVQYIRFTKSTTAGSNIVQDITLNSTPQAVIIWADGTTSDNTFNEGYQFYYGFSDGTNNACVSAFAADNVTTTDTFSGLKWDKAISMMNSTIGTVASEAAVTFGSNKATFTWSTNDNRAVYIHMMAIWGVTAAEVKTFDAGRTTAGTQTYTLTNSSLVPKFIQTFSIANSNATPWNTAFGNAITIGSASSASKQWTVGNTQSDAVLTSAAGTYAKGYYDSTNALVMIDDDGGSIIGTAQLSSFNTGNFVLNWTDPSNTIGNKFSALVIDGTNIDVGTFNEPTVTGTQVVSIDASVNTVSGVMLFSNGQVTSGSTTDALLSVGGGSGTGATDQGVVSVGDDDVASGGTITARINKTGSIVKSIMPAATATSSTTPCEAALSALGTDQFSLNWSARNSTRRNHYIVFGTG